jgi:hypothetical protein
LTLELFLCSLYLAKIAIFLDYAKTILAFRNNVETNVESSVGSSVESNVETSILSLRNLEICPNRKEELLSRFKFTAQKRQICAKNQLTLSRFLHFLPPF